MIRNIFSKLFNKKLNCVLVTPPILMPETFYTATPILVGQLLSNGFSARSFDLNIKFFRKILTIDYINKTKKLLESKNISYDKENVDYIIQNLETSLNTFSITYQDSEGYDEANNVLKSALSFISSPYKSFLLDRLDGFDCCFKTFDYSYKKLKELTFDENENIFIPFFKEVINELKNQKIDFIGITIPFPATLIPAFTFARLLKENTKIHVSLGGALLTEKNVKANPEIFDIYCDSVLIGDGEESICALVDALENKKKLENVSGIIFKKNKNKIISVKPAPITSYKNISNLSLEGICFSDYLKKDPSIHMMISKGCYWGKCKFCGIALKYPRYCIQSVEQVISQIKDIKTKYPGTFFFNFQDDALHPNYLSLLADALIKENLNINYFVFARFEKEFTKELFEKLYKSGLRAIFWGLESGCQSVLNAMNKGVDLNIVTQILKDSYELGINNMTAVIINFPTETMEEYDETVKFISTIKQYATISPGNFTVMKDSVIEKEHEKYNVELIGSNDFSYDYNWNNKNMSYSIREEKWNHFCKFIKEGEYVIDYNKEI